MNEFELIEHYFNKIGEQNEFITIGIGDDCAAMKIPSDKELVFSMDTLVESIHFHSDDAPYQIASRALRVCISDLAAMGAVPLCFTLSLSMPTADSVWLEEFSKGLMDTAVLYDCKLVGGDTVRGPLVITIQVHGTVNLGQALKRSNANIGDLILITGPLGGAAAALKVKENNINITADAQQYLESCFYYPQPQIEVGKLFSGVASAAIDISDGLLSDLGHICKASNVGAQIDINKIPISHFIINELSDCNYHDWALYGGDDYQLCITVPKDFIQVMGQNSPEKYDVSIIGEITAGSEIEIHKGGEKLNYCLRGFTHF